MRSTVAIGLSILALIISATIFFSPPLRIGHSLKAVIVPDLDKRETYSLLGDTPFSANVAFINEGRHNETVITVEIAGTIDHGDARLGPTVGPFFIKPGETAVARVQSPFSSNYTEVLQPDFPTEMTVDIAFIDQDGNLARRSLLVGTILLGSETGKKSLNYKIEPNIFSQYLSQSRWPL